MQNWIVQIPVFKIEEYKIGILQNEFFQIYTCKIERYQLEIYLKFRLDLVILGLSWLTK